LDLGIDPQLTKGSIYQGFQAPVPSTQKAALFLIHPTHKLVFGVRAAKHHPSPNRRGECQVMAKIIKEDFIRNS